jgi:hypothetical protein
MAGSILDLREAAKGMFSQYETPLFVLTTLAPIFGNDRLTGLVMDIHRRLRQLDRFHTAAWDYINKLGSIKNPPERFEEAPEKHGEVFKARMNAMNYATDAAEAFYLFGFRIYDASRKVALQSVGKSNLCPAPRNFMNVRNHIIVHPEKAAGYVSSWSAAFTNQQGVVLHDIRASPAYKDPGLGPNARELEAYISAWITAIFLILSGGEGRKAGRPAVP